MARIPLLTLFATLVGCASGDVSTQGTSTGASAAASSGTTGSTTGHAAAGSTSGHSAGTTSGVAGTTASSNGSASTSGAPTGLLNPAYTTTWNPGILADTPTGAALGADGLPVRMTTCQSVAAQSGDATAAIQGALTACAGTNQVVLLAAGTYSVSASIDVPGGVILRGAGSDETTGTILVSTNGGPVLQVGTMQDDVCYNASGFDSSAQPLLTADALKETSTVQVASGAGFMPGDLALIDQADTSEVDEGDLAGGFMRLSGHAASERVAIASVSGNTVTLATPLHFTFQAAQQAQLSRVVQTAVAWSGIEHLVVQGGRPGGYAGQHAGGIELSNAAYSWVKDVQVDGTTAGMPIRMIGTYRCVVRDSHVHNSYTYGFDQDNYGIVMACGAADDLVENNVSRFLNKPIVFNNSGGGNVIGYNYTDNSWSCDGSNDDGWQEVSIDCHSSFPHMELIEGNWAPHVGASATHGNAGYLTFFRNYDSSQMSPNATATPAAAIIWSQPFYPQYDNVSAVQLDAPDINMTVVGNVLGSTANATPGLPTDLGTTGLGQGIATATSQVFAAESGLMILEIDQTTTTWSSLWLTGNYDTVNAQTMWNASPATASLPMTARTLPASLYLKSQPTWWPAGSPWPWVGPDLTPMVNALPAKAVTDAFNYTNGGDPTCALNCNNYCCTAGASCVGL